MALDEAEVNKAIRELIRKFGVNWHLLTAILTVMNQDSPKLMERIKATIRVSRELQNDPETRDQLDQAITQLEEIERFISGIGQE